MIHDMRGFMNDVSFEGASCAVAQRAPRPRAADGVPDYRPLLAFSFGVPKHWRAIG